jgi:hypothetical protein
MQLHPPREVLVTLVHVLMLVVRLGNGRLDGERLLEGSAKEKVPRAAPTSDESSHRWSQCYGFCGFPRLAINERQQPLRKRDRRRRSPRTALEQRPSTSAFVHSAGSNGLIFGPENGHRFHRLDGDGCNPELGYVIVRAVPTRQAAALVASHATGFRPLAREAHHQCQRLNSWTLGYRLAHRSCLLSTRDCNKNP